MLRKSIVFFIMLSLLITFYMPVTQQTHAASSTLTWSNVNKSAEANNLNDIVVNSQHIYVAVGDGGTILSSSDKAQSWQSTSTSTMNNLRTAATNGTRFVVAGDGGSLLTSQNGQSWASGKLNFSFSVKESVKIDNPKYYEDQYAINWNAKIERSDLQIASVLWDGKRFVALGEWKKTFYQRNTGTNGAQFQVGGSVLLTSPDGLNWSLKKLAIPQDNIKLLYTGKQYAAVSKFTVSTSSDLSLWQTTNSKLPSQFTDMVYINGKYVATGWDGRISGPTGTIHTSTDGKQWTSVLKKTSDAVGKEPEQFKGLNPLSSFSNIIMNSLVWDGHQYVIAGYNGMIMRSMDGAFWYKWSDYNSTFQPFQFSDATGRQSNLNKIIFDGSQYVMAGNNGTILTSTDLKRGTVVRERPSTDFKYIAFNGHDRYIAGGENGPLWESADGYSWKPFDEKTLKSDLHWSGITAINGTAIAVGQERDYAYVFGYKDAKYYYSTEPGVWVERELPVKIKTIYSTASINNVFYIFGDKGYITSTDGLNWSKLKSTAQVMSTVVSNGTVMIGQTNNPEVLYSSSDGSKWNKISVTQNNKKFNLKASHLVWNGKQFITFNASAFTGNDSGHPVIATSSNGITWNVKNASSSGSFYSPVSWNGQIYVTAGRDGNLQYSSDGITFKTSPKATKHLISAILWDGRKFIAAGENATILVTGTIPGANALQYEEQKENFYIHFDYEAEQQEIAAAALVEAKAVAERMAVVPEIGLKHGFTVLPDADIDSIYCSLQGSDDVENSEFFSYQSYDDDKFKNRITIIRMLSRGAEDVIFDLTRDIVEAHTGASMNELEDSLKQLVSEKPTNKIETQISGINMEYVIYLNPDSGQYEIDIWY
ncbi:hypothetical protein [Paenibacillus sp. FSL K6-2859]|uniref:hypothetical protein n=1 Tax=Paenibacillus sp. FSL K6-2859 TaxID=2921482 RepID=UPI0030F56915